jgi:hypothetical protein
MKRETWFKGELKEMNLLKYWMMQRYLKKQPRKWEHDDDGIY